MNIIIDLILCVIIAAALAIGLKVGFVKIAAKPVKFVLALVIAFSVCSTVADMLIVPAIEQPVASYVSDFLYENCAGLTAENAGEELPTLLKIAAAIFGIDIAETASGASSVVDSIAESLTSPVVDVISIVASFFLCYFVVKILFGLAFMIINKIFEIGVFSIFNKALGLLLSGALGVVLAWAVAVVLEFVFKLPVLESNPTIASFEGGFIYRFFNTYNPMELLLSF